MKITARTLIAVSVLFALAAGCNQTKEAPQSSAETSSSKALGNVAIIDVDAVAENLGHKQQIANAIKQKDQAYVKQLGVIKTTYQERLVEMKKKSGEHPTPEQSKQMVQSANVFNRSMKQNTAKARKALLDYKAVLVAQYRAQVKQVAQEIAAERGLEIILVKTNTVLAHDMAVDITDAVIERIRVKQAKAKKVADAEQPKPEPGTRVPEKTANDEPADSYRR